MKSVWFISGCKDEFILPGGAWSGDEYECCKKKTSNCLDSLYKNPTLVQEPVSWETLEIIHTKTHLETLKTQREVLYDVFEIDVAKGAVTEEDNRHVLTPLRYNVNVIIQSAQYAYENNAIVFAPHCGCHHASPDLSQGACVFSDVPLSWMMLRAKHPGIKALYIDVDVHHANGFAQTVSDCKLDDFFMVDLYNEDIYPFNGDCDTPSYVTIPAPFHNGIGTKEYLALLSKSLERAAVLPKVDIVYYVCSNDAMMCDKLGNTKVTERGVYERDMMVVKWARERNLPIVLMPSRGYSTISCRVIRESMARICDEYNIDL